MTLRLDASPLQSAGAAARVPHSSGRTRREDAPRRRFAEDFAIGDKYSVKRWHMLAMALIIG